MKPENQAPPKTKSYEPVHPLQKVIVGWKMILGVPRDDRKWDKMYFKMNLRMANELLDFFDGDWRMAVDCAEDVYTELTKKGLDCSLRAVKARAWEWKRKRMEAGNETSI